MADPLAAAREPSGRARRRTEALRIELLTNGADARLARLALQQTLVELLLQVNHIQARGRRARHVLHPQLPVLGPLPARGTEEGGGPLELANRSRAPWAD